MKTKPLTMDCDDCYRAEISQLKQSNAELLVIIKYVLPVLKRSHDCDTSDAHFDMVENSIKACQQAIANAISNQPT